MNITLADIVVNSVVVGKEATGWTANGVSPQIGNVLSYTKTIYDEAGRVLMTIALDEEGYEQPTGYKYDDAGKQVAIADAKDYGLESADYEEDTETGFFVIKDIVLNDLLNTDIDTLDNVSTTLYEGNRRKSVTDDRGNTTEFVYDALGRITKTIYPESMVSEGGANPVHTYTHVGYDALGRKIWQSETTNADGETVSVPESEIKDFYYDATGRLTTVVLPQVPDPQNSNTLTNPRYDYYLRYQQQSDWDT